VQAKSLIVGCKSLQLKAVPGQEKEKKDHSFHRAKAFVSSARSI
jgi:hypothetical protein